MDLQKTIPLINRRLKKKYKNKIRIVYKLSREYPIFAAAPDSAVGRARCDYIKALPGAVGNAVAAGTNAIILRSYISI
jgi:hypothetical protein